MKAFEAFSVNPNILKRFFFFVKTGIKEVFIDILFLYYIHLIVLLPMLCNVG